MPSKDEILDTILNDPELKAQLSDKLKEKEQEDNELVVIDSNSDEDEKTQQSYEVVNKEFYQPHFKSESSVIPDEIRLKLPSKKVENHLKQLDDVSYASLIEYGADEQQRMGDRADEVLRVVKSGDNPNSIKKDLDSLMSIFNNSDPTELFPEEQTFFQRLKNKGKRTLEEAFASFNNDAMRLTNIQNRLEKGQDVLQRDIVYMNKLKDAVLNNYKDTYPLIAALEEKKYDIQENELKPLKQRIDTETQSLELSSAYNDANNAIQNIDKKIHSLQASQMTAKRTYDDISMMQMMNEALSSNIRDQVVNVIPAWKSQLSQAYTANRQAAYAKLNELMYDHTDEMLRSNSEKMQETALKIAASAEKSYVNIETLQEIERNMEDTTRALAEIKRLGQEKRIRESEDFKQLSAKHEELIKRVNDLNKAEIERSEKTI